MTPELDTKLLAEVHPDDVASYLRATGWRETGSYDRVRVWSRTAEGAEVDVLLPVSAELSDYPVRLVELISTVAEVEQRASADILHYFRHPLTDTQYIRTVPGGPSGTIPLNEGMKAVQGLHSLVTAAATGAVLAYSPAVLPKGQKPRKAARFVERVRMGTPSPGSYVFRLETPVRGSEDEREPLDPRTVLLHLYRSVHAAHSAASESARDGTPRAFDSRVRNGVTSNLCDALAEIGGNRRTGFEFHFAWAPTVPVSEATPDLRFTTDHVHALRDAKKHLEQSFDTEPATVVGHPVDLKYRDQPTGRVVIEGLVSLHESTEQRSVAMRLTRAQYDLVAEAHRPERRARVRVTGLVRASGRQWDMPIVHDVDVLD